MELSHPAGMKPEPIAAGSRKISRAERAMLILERLAATYPDAHCELHFQNPLELLVATILSAQCTDKRVNIVTKQLFRDYPNAAAYAAASQEELEQAVKSTGFFRNKAKSLRTMAQELVDRFDGEVPRSIEQLVSLAGVGRKTANVVLGNAYQIDEGIVVDTHVSRLSQRFKFIGQTDPAKIEEGLMRLVPRAQWTVFSHRLIFHGRRRCFAQRPDCPGCELADLCPSFGLSRKPLKSTKTPAVLGGRTSKKSIAKSRQNGE